MLPFVSLPFVERIPTGGGKKEAHFQRCSVQQDPRASAGRWPLALHRQAAATRGSAFLLSCVLSLQGVARCGAQLIIRNNQRHIASLCGSTGFFLVILKMFCCEETILYLHDVSFSLDLQSTPAAVTFGFWRI